MWMIARVLLDRIGAVRAVSSVTSGAITPPSVGAARFSAASDERLERMRVLHQVGHVRTHLREARGAERVDHDLRGPDEDVGLDPKAREDVPVWPRR